MVGYDTTSGYAAEKIAEQFRREKLLKVAEQLAKAAEKLEDEKEKEYFLDVIKELRLKYHGY